MKLFFTSDDIESISELLNGEKLLNAARAEDGSILLTFESAYEGASDLLAITPSGEIVGTFACYDGPDGLPS